MDTNKVKGKLIKEIKCAYKGNFKCIIEYNPSNEIQKRVTEYEKDSLVSTIKTYFDKKELFGNIKENEYDNKGNLVKEIVYSINKGKKNIEGVFDITNKLDDKGNILFSKTVKENDSLQSFSIYYTYEKGVLKNSYIKDYSGNLISENSYTYNEKGLVINHILKLPDFNTVKKFKYKYENGKKVEEMEIVNNDTTRISHFDYHDGYMNRIIRKDLKKDKTKHIIYIELN